MNPGSKKHEQKDDNDAWSRFERAVDAAVKSGPKHKAGEKPSKKPSWVPADMALLPKDRWRLERMASGYIAAGLFDNAGHRHWVKLAESDFPNDLVSIEDFERLIIDPVHVASV